MRTSPLFFFFALLYIPIKHAQCLSLKCSRPWYVLVFSANIDCQRPIFLTNIDVEILNEGDQTDTGRVFTESSCRFYSKNARLVYYCETI